jgi:hypothetical protein
MTQSLLYSLRFKVEMCREKSVFLGFWAEKLTKKTELHKPGLV